MAVIKCKMCGGDLDLTAGASTAQCEYCGSVQTVPAADDEKKLIQFERAERLRKLCEFDKAAGIYETIVADFRQESEAYWGLVLCKYGIEYVDDPATGKKIPTCHRSSFDSIMEDSDFEQALENADSLARKVYREEAKQIEEIRKGIIAVSANEEPYDIFICYKETDENSDRTLDSVLAQDIYDALTGKGYRVFFSRISLEDKLGVEYEPYIFAALNSARIMLAVGTDYEYYNAVWVKNEWSRFLKLMAKDKSKHLIPCYKGIDAYDMPKEFNKLQAQDLGKVGAMQDLLRGIEKLLPKNEPAKETVVVQQVTGNPTVGSYLRRAFMFLEDGDWDSASEYCEKVLDIDPECAEAYLGKLMAELCVSKQEDLVEEDESFDDSSNYSKAIRFGNDKLKAALTGYIEHINTRNENARLDRLYNRANSAMSAAETESAYKEAAHLFETIRDYLNSAALAKACLENAEAARKDAILSDGKAKMTGDAVFNYEVAIGYFNNIPGWKDADKLLADCQQKIEEIKAKSEADRLEWERKEEAERKEAARIAKRNKKIVIIAATVASIAIVFVLILNNVIIPNSEYNKAVALMDAGEYSEAYTIFRGLGDYQDATEKAGYIRITKAKEQLKKAKVGDCITLGVYEQDNNTSNGKEDIQWLVLAVQENKVLVISKYALASMQYSTDRKDVTWETCEIRKWLNNDFFNVAFTADEKVMIPTVTVSVDEDLKYMVDPGNATQDQVFLLSIAEANEYFNSDSARQCQSTDCVLAEVGFVNGANGNWEWWLRSLSGKHGNARAAAYVDGNGKIREFGSVVSDDITTVRPAMWIDLNKIAD